MRVCLICCFCEILIFLFVFGTLSFGYWSGKYSKKILLSILYFSRGIVLILFLVFQPLHTWLLVLEFFMVIFGLQLFHQQMVLFLKFLELNI